MTRKVDNQRSRRERARAIKEEKRRKGRMRVDRSRATRSPNDAEDPMTIYGSEQEENDGNVMDEPKWNVGDHVVVEDSRVGASRKLFWEVLAVVKSREYVSGEWHYCVDDLDYETKFLYRVPERRLSHSKYSRRIQHGIRNDADGERTTKRVATQYENEQRRSVKRLKLKNRLLREENFKTAQKSLQKDAKIDVLDSQCEKLAREVAEVQNLDFYELLMADRMESKCPLVSYVCNEYQRVFKKLTRIMDDLVLGMLLIVRCCSAPSSYFIYQHTSL